MKISVIIPTYKPQAYLWECLDSLCGQTFPKSDFEVILVLNGCCEPYDGLIKEYITGHPEMQWNYIQTDKGGVSNARNIALSEAKGEYIAFVDDDDYFFESYLEELYSKSSIDTIALSNAYAFIDGASDKQLDYVMSSAYSKYHTNGKQRSSTVRRFFSGPCFKLIHKDIINHRLFDTRFKNGEDSLFMFLISDRVKYVDFTSPNAIYYRRYRKNSAITVKKSKSYVIGNSLKMIWAYTITYFRHPFRYNFLRYTQAILGAIHFILVNIR